MSGVQPGWLQFQVAAEAHGLRFPDGPPEADGTLHRVPAGADKDGKRAGWYVLRDGPAGLVGAFGSWRDGQTVGWGERKGHRMAPEELAELRSQAEVDRRVRDAAKAAKAEAVADDVNALLGGPDVRVFHRGDRVRLEEEGPWGLDYLVAKGFDYAPSTVYLHTPTGRLLLPIRNAAMRVVNLQRVWWSEEGRGSWVKGFLPGGQVKGGWMVVPGVGNLGDGPIAIAEGYATAATMAQASGLWTLVALNAGNLVDAAAQAREVWPRAELVVVADDDWATEGNPGLTKATQAANLVGARVVVPDFGPEGERLEGETDLNDQAARLGLESVKATVASNLRAPPIAPPIATVVDREAEALEALEPRAPWVAGERPSFPDRPVLIWSERRPKPQDKVPTEEPAGWVPTHAPTVPARVPVLHRGVSGMLAGAGGYGKTHLAARLAVAVASGGDWVQLNLDPTTEPPMADVLTITEPGCVLWVCAEEDAAEAGRRLWLACQRNADGTRASMAEVDRRAALVSQRVRVVALADTAAEGDVLVRVVQTRDPATGEQFTRSKPQRMFERLRAALAEPCDGVPWRLVILDPMAELVATGAESESDAMREALRAGIHPLRNSGATVLVLHHTRKGTADAGKTDPVDLVRGSSAIVGSMRWVGLLWRPPGARPGVVALDVVKSNYARPPRTAWLRWGLDGEGWLRPCTPEELEPQPKAEPKAKGRKVEPAAVDDVDDVDGADVGPSWGDGF